VATVAHLDLVVPLSADVPIALLHDEVEDVGIGGAGVEPSHGADTLAEMEALAYRLVPNVSAIGPIP
jgi:hypothetical protein